MSKRTGSTDQTICHVLRRHRGQRTVLAVALPVLAAQLNAVRMRREFSGLTEKEIQRGFCEIAGKYLKSDYHSTYIARRLGPRGFLETIDGRYRIRQSLLKRVSIEELAALHDELVASLKSAYEERQAAMQRLEATCKLPPECIAERHSLINA
ncbi:MAG: hypothetical protein HYS13_19105, partial [Planctomycetia bacterium]|nr:hypothetical protein [Planctomycetia bacterium]